MAYLYNHSYLIFAFFQVAHAANWALLVAGSYGYRNYRHQADVCHAYQVLRQHGFPKRNIIVMMRDDIAYNIRNPYNGTIINKPGGPNVYKGVPKDYTGNDVLAKNFLNILKGNKAALRGIGSGKVINSDRYDNIFVYYSNHGGRGQIAFPGSSLYEYQLSSVIQEMHKNKRYNKMVFYMDACYSGSMFYKGKLPNYLNVYAVTAANESESSYAAYYDRNRRAYLGDVFSVNWLEHSTKADCTKTTLGEQYTRVQNITNGSHVMWYGDSLIGNLLLNQFQGPTTSKNDKYNYQVPITDRVPTWAVHYMTLWHDFDNAKTTKESLDILNQMEEMVEIISTIRGNISKIAGHFMQDVSLLRKFASEPTTEDEQKCYEKVSESFREYVGSDHKFEYALRELHVFENLCIKGYSTESILGVVKKVCGG